MVYRQSKGALGADGTKVRAALRKKQSYSNSARLDVGRRLRYAHKAVCIMCRFYFNDKCLNRYPCFGSTKKGEFLTELCGITKMSHLIKRWYRVAGN